MGEVIYYDAKDLEKFMSEKESRSIRDFLTGEKVDYLQFEGSYGNKRAFTNINSPSDVEKISFDFYI